MNKIILKPSKKVISGSVNLSGSKSISNRALLMKNLSGSKIKFDNLSTSDDTKRIKFYLEFIDTCLSSNIPMIIDTQNAGTVMRFLTAYLAIREGKWLMTGIERMKKRPMGELVNALNTLGCNITFTEKTDFPPILIKGGKMFGGRIEINPDKSSQFISALMMIGPYLEDGLEIVLEKKPVSTPYIKMTAQLMKIFGIEVNISAKKITIPAGDYEITELNIEPDWSSVSYWYEIAALTKDSNIFIPGLSINSLQGDSIVAEIYNNLGVETIYKEDGILIKSKVDFNSEFEFNFKDYPDLVPAVMATCAAKGIELKIKGINHLKYKESDRIISMDEELAKVGCSITRQGQVYLLKPGKLGDMAEFNTHDDHRIAMSLAPLAIVIDEVTINNPDVTIKSYPDFWNDMIKLNVFTKS